MNYNEMTAAQCADWLAEKDGWNHEPPQVDGMGDQREYWWKWTISSKHGGRTYAYKPPFELTLDAAAGALREPWRLRSVAYCDDRKAWQAIIERVNKQDTLWTWYAPDRMTAEYRAAVAARMEEEHEQSR